jgi:hypothetical protein
MNIYISLQPLWFPNILLFSSVSELIASLSITPKHIAKPDMTPDTKLVSDYVYAPSVRQDAPTARISKSIIWWYWY